MFVLVAGGVPASLAQFYDNNCLWMMCFPIIQGTDVDWNKAFQGDQSFGYSDDTNWSPSSWTGGATPESTSSFNEAYDPANFKSGEGFDFAKKLDWSNTYSFGD